MSWRNVIPNQGKYPKKAFAGILTAIYPTENKNGTKLLQLDFEDESQVGIYGIGKAEITEEGIKIAGSLAQFAESLISCGASLQLADENGEIMGAKIVDLKTGVDIERPKLYMEPLPGKVGDDTQTQDSVFWGTVKKLERTTSNKAEGTTTTTTTTSKQKPGKLPKPNVVDDGPEVDLKSTWEDVLMKLLEAEPLSEKDCQLRLKNIIKEPEYKDAAKVRKAMSDYRAQNNLFKTFKDEGFLEQLEDGKYQVAV